MRKINLHWILAPLVTLTLAAGRDATASSASVDVAAFAGSWSYTPPDLLSWLAAKGDTTTPIRQLELTVDGAEGVAHFVRYGRERVLGRNETVTKVQTGRCVYSSADGTISFFEEGEDRDPIDVYFVRAETDAAGARSLVLAPRIAITPMDDAKAFTMVPTTFCGEDNPCPHGRNICAHHIDVQDDLGECVELP
jgi:hypothetical protein